MAANTAARRRSRLVGAPNEQLVRLSGRGYVSYSPISITWMHRAGVPRWDIPGWQVVKGGLRSEAKGCLFALMLGGGGVVWSWSGDPGPLMPARRQAAARGHRAGSVQGPYSPP